MGVETKKVEQCFPKDAEHLKRGDVTLSVGRNESGDVTDVTCRVKKGECDVVLHEDEAMVIKGEDFRFYKFKGRGVSRMERLFAGEPKEISKKDVNSDMLLIESARRLYEDALEHPEGFRSEEFEA